MSYKANDRAPVVWNGLLRACVCQICGAQFKGRQWPTDRGSYPARNRARGLAIRHVNEKHPDAIARATPSRGGRS